MCESEWSSRSAVRIETAPEQLLALYSVVKPRHQLVHPFLNLTCLYCLVWHISLTFFLLKCHSKSFNRTTLLIQSPTSYCVHCHMVVEFGWVYLFICKNSRETWVPVTTRSLSPLVVLNFLWLNQADTFCTICFGSPSSLKVRENVWYM